LYRETVESGDPNKFQSHLLRERHIYIQIVVSYIKTIIPKKIRDASHICTHTYINVYTCVVLPHQHVPYTYAYKYFYYNMEREREKKKKSTETGRQRERTRKTRQRDRMRGKASEREEARRR